MGRSIDVAAGPYVSACSEFYDANHAILDKVSSLNSTLGGCGSMAGSDSGGQEWAKQYDSVAGQLMQAGADIGESMAQMANLLNGSLVNHKGADHGAMLSTPRGYQTGDEDGDKDPNHYTQRLYPSGLPSANGGTGDNPSWWHWLVDHLDGFLWPDADTGKMRSAGSAWISAGLTLTTYAGNVEAAKGTISLQSSPEVADAMAACTELKGHVTDLADGYATIGKACNDYAQHVDDHHQMIQDELVSFLEWTAGIEIVGGFISFFTVGLAEAPTQAVEAAEVANAASKVLRILKALVELARTVATTIGALLEKVTEIVSRLKKFREAKRVKAVMATVRETGKLGESGAKIVKNTRRIEAASGKAAYRIPDELNDFVLGEVKNVSKQGLTSQITDFLAYATKNGLEFRLYVRSATELSKPLQDLVNAGRIILVRRLP